MARLSVIVQNLILGFTCFKFFKFPNVLSFRYGCGTARMNIMASFVAVLVTASGSSLILFSSWCNNS